MSRKYSQLPPNARAIIWCAVSTTQQAGEDKASMDEQRNWGLEVCEENGWRVIDVLNVPGHSRNYKDIHTLASDARAKGIDAFDHLITHLEKADFDIFICRDANRFARRASLLHYLIESIVEDCGAVIYSQNDGMITRDNMAGFAALKGYSTAQDISWIREGTAIGKRKRVKRGLPASGMLSSSHKIERDPVTGKAIKLVINEEMSLFYSRLAKLVLEGFAWHSMGRELYEQWGYLSSKGRFYSSNSLYYRMYNPLIWGNITTGREKHPIGEWVFHEHPSKPKELDVEYGIIEPIYTGSIATDLQVELLRRMKRRGRARTQDPYRFSGTCICGVCGRPMAVSSTQAPKYGSLKQRNRTRKCSITPYGTMQWGLHCNGISDYKITGRRNCNNTSIYQKPLEDFWSSLIAYCADGNQLGTYFSQDGVEETQLISPENLLVEIQKIEGQVKTLIIQQSLAPDSTQDLYRQQILHLSDQLQSLQHEYDKLVRYAYQAPQIDVEELKSIDIEQLWSWSDLKINQFLRKILGSYRLLVVNGAVVGMKIV